MLEVIVPAVSQDLVTLAETKSYLGIAGTSLDARLQIQISAASQTISDFLRRVLVLETVEETFYGSLQKDRPIILERWPVVSIISVEEDEAALVSTDYWINKRDGLLSRFRGGLTSWGTSVVVRYQAGFGAMPAWAKMACFDQVKLLEEMGEQETGVKSERFDGIAQVAYFDEGGIGKSGLASSIETRIVMHRDLRV